MNSSAGYDRIETERGAVRTVATTVLAYSSLLLLVCSASTGCKEPPATQQSAKPDTKAARRNLEAIKRVNRREIEAATASGDPNKIADAKVRATTRLAEAERGVGDALVEQTLSEVEEKRKAIGRKVRKSK